MNNHLVENWKDRIPTEILSNGAVRYEQFDSNGNSLGYVYMKRADEPTEIGNVWNKVTYDGIKEAIGALDLNKLAITSKATQAEAEAGEDNSKYMTPLRTNQAIKQLCDIRAYNLPFTVSAASPANYNLNDYINEKTVMLEIESYVKTYSHSSISNCSKWKNNGNLYGILLSSSGISALSQDLSMALATAVVRTGFKLAIDVKSKQFYLLLYGKSTNGGIINYSIVVGICSVEQFGSIYAAPVNSTDETFLKLKAYDSPIITN